jgi:hypothetical protein
MFHLFKDDLRGCILDNISYSDALQIHFSTGVVQEFPLSADVSVPHVSVSAQELELGSCLLGHSLSSSLTLYNTTHSALPWTLHTTHGLGGVMRVHPSSGLLPPHLNAEAPSTHHIHLTFTPDAECEYSGHVVVEELLTGCEVHVAVTATVITDEGHSH